ncbi:hypothetical protein IJN73_00960 [Candidatus Saccharibacteria bacterium]|nr:hypothetical protein [Candidatus Saccharibacteria bacterium]
MEDLIQKYHSDQTRNGGKLPYIVHLFGVANILTSVIAISGGNIDDQTKEDLYLAALGHDLLEDTTVSEQEIISASNEQVLSIIQFLTNPEDDEHTKPYMEKLASAPEEARLVKYADLIDNTFSVAYGLSDLDSAWVLNVFLPIVKNTTNTLNNTDFTKYPQISTLLQALLYTATNRLYSELKILQ